MKIFVAFIHQINQYISPKNRRSFELFMQLMEKRNTLFDGIDMNTGANFVGTSYGCDYFVLKGKAEIKICGNVYNLEAGKHYKIPKCSYELKVIGNESFEYMAVYDLPENLAIPK